MGEGEAGRPMTEMTGASEERSLDGIPGGEAAGGGDTGEATATAADEAGARGRHGAKTVARERVAGRQENPAGDSYGVGDGGEDHKAYGGATDTSGVRGDGGGRKAYGVVENLGGGVRE